MSKSKLNITLDEREKINPKDIDGDGKPDGKPFDMLNDGEGYERDYQINTESRKEMRFKKKEKWINIKLRLGNGLRLVERFANKYLGFLVGNNSNPIPQLSWLSSIKLNWIYLIIIIVLAILLWIK